MSEPKKLILKWWQVRLLKEQIEAAEEALTLGKEGMITMNNGCVIEWDSFNVYLEIPEDNGGD